MKRLAFFALIALCLGACDKADDPLQNTLQNVTDTKIEQEREFGEDYFYTYYYDDGTDKWKRTVKLIYDKAYVIFYKKDLEAFDKKIKDLGIEMIEDKPDAGLYGVSGYRYNLYDKVQTAKPLKNTLHVCLKANFRDFLGWDEVAYAAPFYSLLDGYSAYWSRYPSGEVPVHNTMIAWPMGGLMEQGADGISYLKTPEELKEFYEYLGEFAKNHNMLPVYERFTEPDGNARYFEITKETDGDVFSLSKEFEKSGLGWLYPAANRMSYSPGVGFDGFNNPDYVVPVRIDDFTIREDDETDDVWWLVKDQWLKEEDFLYLWRNDKENWFDEKWW